MSHPSESPSSSEQGGLRSPSRRTWVLAAIGVTSGGVVLLSCGGGGGSPTAGAAATGGGGPAPAPTAPPTPPAPAAPPAPAPAPAGAGPALGAHGLAFHRLGPDASSLSVSGLSTRASGSTLLVCVGRGALRSSTTPTDNAGNLYSQLDVAHTYTLHTGSGTALFGCAQALGMGGHEVSVSKPTTNDEVTLTVVEIQGAGAIRDVKWTEVLTAPLTSASVTTTGPALLVAWWWGDAGVQNDKTAVPDNGFTVIDAVLDEGALVQCAVAVRQVDAAGTYNVTWTATPAQGAQLWLVAVQQAV